MGGEGGVERGELTGEERKLIKKLDLKLVKRATYI